MYQDQAGALYQKLGDADGQTDGQTSRLKMTVSGNTRQVQLAVEAVLFGRQNVCSWLSATATRCEESNYFKLQQQTRHDCQGGTTGDSRILPLVVQWGDMHDRRHVFSGWAQGGHGSMAVQVQTAIGGGGGAAGPGEEEQEKDDEAIFDDLEKESKAFDKVLQGLSQSHVEQ
jgi:hypothetical protein